MPAEPWRLLFDVSIHAYYAGKIELGRRACEHLLSRTDLPVHIRQRARQNQIFYAPHLSELAPSVALRQITLDTPQGWSRFNPSIAAADDGYHMTVRSSNYTTDDRMRFMVTDSSLAICTTNYLLSLDAHFGVRRSEALADKTTGLSRFPFPVRGFEDCRLFTYRGAWHAVATTREHNPAGICQIALLRLHDGALCDAHLLSDAAPGRHEKNWIPVPLDNDLLFVYSCRPTIVLQYDETRRVVEKIRHHHGPVIATDFRGGSQAIKMDDGYILIVHESVNFEDGGRVYPHRFVRMDHEFTITHISPQFFFADRSVEFCAGLAIRQGVLAASFGARDREAYIATMLLDEVIATLQPVATS